MGIFNILLIITGMFFLLLIIKELFKDNTKKKICVICLAVSLTWVMLLILYFLNIFDNNVILALLMGETVLGVYYLAESKVKEELKIFRLPFLLTLTLAAYSVIVYEDLIKSAILILLLWGFFTVIYVYRKNSSLNRFVKKIIECCKRW